MSKRRDVLVGALSASAATFAGTLFAQKAIAQTPSSQFSPEPISGVPTKLRILLLNPNSSPDFTALISREAKKVASPGTEFVEVTSPFGPKYIGTRTTMAIASHAAVDALAQILAKDKNIDAAILAGFGAQGIPAMREFASFPIISLMDASIGAAMQVSTRFSILTGGERWVPMLKEQVSAMGISSRVASVRSIPLTGAEIAQDQDRALTLLTDLANTCVNEDGAECVVFGGAAVAGIPRRIQDRVSVPLIDNVVVAVATAEMLARVMSKPSMNSSRPPAIESTGLSEPLTQMLKQL
ncbi:MAG: aspartate/glutamate racemase family protein [Drouetiella hepatica Uher 2000/2452]|jgi:Asp/Glu/hydantoin racemase|uniref:Aspartate/glutamate racemase family protein n=1 Tax=Drouetiella hepatica Uher 2000/2452 TaxID=904376 RepID=A0A951QFX7_9CYAN|nr:aspartate/glutamate racemase family protein [Drouetiella hepatica Uher 2000/2452]